MDRELHRLEAVSRFKELDPGITKDLNDIVDLAAQICNAPVAIITLLDENKQWFKAAKGTAVTETPRELSFCNYTIEHEGVLIIPDMLLDERYSHNPLVAGNPNVRFYAGAALTTKDGYGVGSLCVVDFQSRQLNQHQQDSLKILSKQVINLMELNYSLEVMATQNEADRHHKKVLEDSEIKLRAVFESSTDVHILVGKDMEILAFNKLASLYIYGIYQHRIAVGERILTYVDPKIKNHFVKYLAIALKGKAIKHDLLIRAGTAFESWREIRFVPIKNNEGEIMGVAVNSADISKRKQQERQIMIQNEALTRIAIIQSHELRRPVASLLGIMNLIKLEQLDFCYYEMMQLTVNELDEKIRMIVGDSERTISSPISIVAQR
jgi:PAS domain S-box-containing protein